MPCVRGVNRCLVLLPVSGSSAPPCCCYPPTRQHPMSGTLHLFLVVRCYLLSAQVASCFVQECRDYGQCTSCHPDLDIHESRRVDPNRHLWRLVAADPVKPAVGNLRVTEAHVMLRQMNHKDIPFGIFFLPSHAGGNSLARKLSQT